MKQMSDPEGATAVLEESPRNTMKHHFEKMD